MVVPIVFFVKSEKSGQREKLSKLDSKFVKLEHDICSRICSRIKYVAYVSVGLIKA